MKFENINKGTITLKTHIARKIKRCYIMLLLVAACIGLGLPTACHADLITYEVTFSDTSNLTTFGPNFDLDFLLTTSGSTSVSITDLDYGVGGSDPGPYTLNNSNNQESIAFTPGDYLSFLLNVDYVPNSGDQLSLAIFDPSVPPSGDYIPTDNPPVNNIDFFTIDFTSPTPIVQTYGSTSYQVAAPSVVATPEPGTWALMGVGLLGLVIVRRRRQIAAASALA